MKRNLITAAIALSAVSPVSFAEPLAPQPSFRDSAEITVYGPGAPEVLREFPRPSFDDAAPVALDGVKTSVDLRPTAEILATFPQPSSIAN
jgi:hypothetical protein